MRFVAENRVAEIVGILLALQGLRKRLLPFLLFDRLFYIWKRLTAQAFARDFRRI